MIKYYDGKRINISVNTTGYFNSLTIFADTLAAREQRTKNYLPSILSFRFWKYFSISIGSGIISVDVLSAAISVITCR